MKNLTLSLTLAFVAILGFAGKTNAQSSTRVGLKAGLTYMTLGSATSNGISINYDYRPGFQGGIFVETALSESVLFTAQALYTQKGGNINTTISGITFKGSSTVNYIDVPILVGFKANPKLAFYVGPQVSFLTSTKSVLTINGATTTDDDKSSLNSTLFGGNIGAGYEIADNVGLNLNYITDFSHAAKTGFDAGEKNSGFILSLGIKF
jgi:outer membrane immunogenic protein